MLFSVNDAGTGFELDGVPFQVVGLRVSNSLISAAETQRLIDNMDLLDSYGINTYSVFFQGSRFGDIAGYNEDSTLNVTYADRMSQIIEAADSHGAVVLVGGLYYGDSDGWWPSWGQTEANEAIANTVQWLADHQYYNVFIDVDNEHMSPFDDSALIAAGKAVNPTYVMGASGEDTPWNADVALHLNVNYGNLPYIESEGFPGGWEFWSQNLGIDNYLAAGIYSDDLKAEWLQLTTNAINSGQGYMAASPWLQAAPSLGPNPFPGGYGTPDDPGIAFWFDHVKELVGSAVPPPPPPELPQLFATLVNADTDGDIGLFEDGAVLDFSYLGTQNLSVRADPWTDTTGSVAFDLDGVRHVENILPYAIAGDDPQSDYNPWVPQSGSHTLVLTPYSGEQATGVAGASLTIHFDVL